jgi:hypothetical protein
MKEKFLTSTYGCNNTNSEFGLLTSEGKQVKLGFEAVRDPKTGGVQFTITVPHAEALVFPDDLPRLVRAFGWGIVDLLAVMLIDDSRINALGAMLGRCARLMCKIDYIFRHPDYDV